MNDWGHQEGHRVKIIETIQRRCKELTSNTGDEVLLILNEVEVRQKRCKLWNLMNLQRCYLLQCSKAGLCNVMETNSDFPTDTDKV